MRRRPSRSSLAFRWVGLLVLLAIGGAYVHPLRAYLSARTDVKAKRAEVAVLSREKAALAGRLKLVGTHAFVERQARELGLVRPGEHLYIVSGVEEWKKRAGTTGGAGVR
ncbi:MAG: septum formation initiator family protein [Actinobacteria bacterium]|nr:MAG: septum formation initiator family protein [Actinomycetota bacterium]